MMLLATMLNYMDRVLLNQAAKQIKLDLDFATFSWAPSPPVTLDLSETNYSLLEGAFGICYAFGALFFGWAADKFPVVWLYPLCVAGWSLAGIGSGFATDYPQLLASRALLGFFEAANWPCGVVTTRLLMTREKRSLGNGIFHGGGALGAMLTPLLLLIFSLPGGLHGVIWGGEFSRLLGDKTLTPNWRLAFQIVGILGFAWAFLWLVLTRKNHDVWQPKENFTSNPAETKLSTFLGNLLFSREFWILLVTVCSINATWHLLRVWLPLFMQEAHDYTLGQLSLFSMAYYLMADLGAMGAGALVLWFSKKWGVDNARTLVFGIGSLICLQTLICPKMDDGWILRITLWAIGMGSMCLFPVYFAQTQEVSARNSGKVTGIMGFFCWFFLYFLQTNVGSWLDQRKDVLKYQAVQQGVEEIQAKKEATRRAYVEAIPYAGLPPILAFGCLLFWPRKKGSRIT